jgi:hypothetical protein
MVLSMQLVNFNRKEFLEERLKLIARLSNIDECPINNEKDKTIWEMRNRDWEKEKIEILRELLLINH